MGLGGAFAVVDSPIAVSGRRSANAATGPRWFRKMDKNRDGDVSRRDHPIQGGGYRSLDEGARVSFVVQTGQKGLQAAEVEIG